MSYRCCFPCLLPPRFPAELLPPSAPRWGGGPAAPWLLGLAHRQDSSPSHRSFTPPARCCRALCLRDEGSKQAGPAGISSPGWSTSCSVTLENRKQPAKAWRRQWGAAEAGMGDGGMPVCAAEYGWRPEPILLGQQLLLRSKVPLPFPPPHPLPPARQAVTYLAVLRQILLVRADCHSNRSVSLLIKEFLCVVQASFHPRVPCSRGRSLLFSLRYVVL